MFLRREENMSEGRSAGAPQEGLPDFSLQHLLGSALGLKNAAGST
jgi:hypothetical protein